MKEYIRSFRVFFGRCNLLSLLAFLGVMAAMVVVAALLEVFAAGGDFTAGVSAGMSVMLSGIVPLTGMLFLSTLYTYINPAIPGHKFYRSIPDSAGHFHRAVIAASVFSLVLGLAILGVMCVIYLLLNIPISTAYFGLIMLLSILGLCNFTGYIKSAVWRAVTIGGIMCLTGFLAGFLGAAEDDESSFSEVMADNMWVYWFILGAALLLYAGGFIYTAAVSRKKWISCEDKERVDSKKNKENAESGAVT